MTAARSVGGRTRAWWPLLVVLVVAGVAALILDATRGMTDLAVYRYGGRAVVDGFPLYAGRDPATDLPYTYPPFAALVMVPLAVVPQPLAVVLWTVASAAALVAVVALCRRTQGHVDRPAVLVAVAAAFVVLEPVWQTFAFGQVNLLLLLAVVVDLLLPERRWTGVLTGVVAGIKLTPLVFVVLLVLIGRRSAAGRAVLAFAATVTIGLACLPQTAWIYWTDTLHDPGRIGGVAYAGNQSAYGVLARLADGEPATVVWLLVAGAISVAAVVVGALAWRAGDRVLGAALGGIAMLVASPISWTHHWVWSVVVVLALWQRSRVGAALWALVFTVGLPWWNPSGDDREQAWGLLAHVVGGAYLLAAVVLVCVAARWVLAERRGVAVIERHNPARAGL